MSRVHSEHVRDESGLSLIELVVTIMLTTIVGVGLVMILVNMWTAQEGVTSVTQATNRGQLVSSTIERAVRNSAAFEVSPDGTTLRVRTTLGHSLTCQGFRLTGGAGQAQLQTSAGALGPEEEWTPWQEAGVVGQGAGPFFDRTAMSLTYAFDIGTESSPVRFTGEISARTPVPKESSPCW